MQRVIEVARSLGVSKVTIYKKMELLKKELKPYIRYRSNIAYIEEPGVELLRQSLSIVPHEEPQIIQPDANADASQSLRADLAVFQAKLVQTHDQQYAELLQQVEMLGHLIKTKREENEKKEHQLKLLQKLVKWNKSSTLFVEKVHGLFIEKRM